MESLKNSAQSIAHAQDLLQSIPGAVLKAMFGGHGLFCQGLMFGCLLKDEIYLRAEPPAGETERRRFAPEVNGRIMPMPYWTAPAEALDSAEAFAVHGKAALQLAIAADLQKPAGKRKWTGG